jgi:hypothetical protein
MKIIKYTLFTLIFGLFLGILPLQAVIVEGEQGKLGNKTITLLSDAHLDDLQKEGPNWQQKHDLFNSISQEAPNNTLLITEDIGDTSSIEQWIGKEKKEEINNFTQLKLSQDSPKAFLVGTADYVNKLGIEVYNAEFRQLMVCALESQSSINVFNVTQIYNKIIEEINEYKDNSDLIREFYKEIVKQYHIDNPFEQMTEESTKYINPKTIYRNIDSANQSDENKEDAKHQLLHYATSLLDVRILNKIRTTDKQHIIVCAGAIHIEILKDCLNSIGYRQIYAKHSPISDSLSDTITIAQWLQYKLFGYKPVYLYFTHNNRSDVYFVKPINIKEFLTEKSIMPRWLKVGFGLAGTAIAYALYKRIFNS